MPKRKPKPTAPGPRVYSYLRFSSAEQAKGDSERRQDEGARAHADKIGLPFDETLRMADRGLSGYHGVHRKRGALGRFLKAVEAGEVPSGSILVVENIDRLGREEVVDALKTIVFGLVNHDITIQTLLPERTYDRKALNRGQIWELIAHIERAHAESKRKSDLGQASWNQKRKLARAEGRILTRMRPAWLNVTKDGRFEKVAEAVTAIHMIFDMKLQGVGKNRIADTLNEKAPWTPPPREKAKRERSEKGNGWRGSYVQKILRNRAVIGEYQPHRKVDGKRVPDGDPIHDYFPRIIEPEVFHAVQERIAENRGKGGQTGKARNLFTHLVKCAYCGASMAFVDKGKPPKGGTYLVCDNGRRGMGCEYRSIRYDECEKAILENCHKLRPEQVLPNPDEQAELCRSLRRRIQGREAELQDTEQQVENLIDQIGRTKDGSIRDRYEARVSEFSARKATIQKQVAEDDRELRKAEAGLQSFTRWKRDLGALKEGITEDVEMRMRLQAHLRELIDRIEVFAVGFQTRYDPDEQWRVLEDLPKKERREARVEYMQSVEGLAEYIDDLCEKFHPGGTLRTGLYWEDGKLRMTDEEKVFYAFLEHIMQRRMSKEGRFLRVHFKTGAKRDVVPEGSLASGMELVKDGRRKSGWRFVSPDLDRLWREFVEGDGRNGKKRKGSRRTRQDQNR